MDPIGTPTHQGPVDLNTASVEQLAELEGIGRLLAERIVANRASAGPFGSVDELARVPGIGADQVENLRPYLTASAPEEIQEEVLPPAFAPSEEDETPSELEMEEPQLPAEDEEELDAELHAYEEMEVPEEDLPPADEPVQETESGAPVEPEESQSAPRAGDEVAAEEPRTAGAEEPPQAEPEPAAAPVPPPVREERRFERQAETHTEPPERERRDGAGRSVLLVLLGGALGVLLTVLLFVIFPGTLAYAPMSLVMALSRNMDTMQANQELTWERVNQLSAQTNDLELRMAELEALAGQVSDLEEQVADLEDQAAQSAEQLGDLDGRVEAAEDELDTQSTQIAELDDNVAGMQERVTVFDNFFRALRELLLQMEPAPADELES